MKIKRVRRGCYDKYHRCPGWAGGGLRYAEVTVCEGLTSLPDAYEGNGFKFHPDCGTLVLPRWTKWLDPTWWLSVIRFRFGWWR